MPCGCGDFRNAAERQFSPEAGDEGSRAVPRAKGPGPTTRLLLAGLATAGPLRGGTARYRVRCRGACRSSCSNAGGDERGGCQSVIGPRRDRRSRGVAPRPIGVHALSLQGDFLDIAHATTIRGCRDARSRCLLLSGIRTIPRRVVTPRSAAVFAFSYPFGRWYRPNMGRRRELWKGR